MIPEPRTRSIPCSATVPPDIDRDIVVQTGDHVVEEHSAPESRRHVDRSDEGQSTKGILDGDPRAPAAQNRLDDAPILTLMARRIQAILALAVGESLGDVPPMPDRVSHLGQFCAHALPQRAVLGSEVAGGT